MQLGLDRGSNQIAAFLCREHDMHEDPGERLCHGRILQANPTDRQTLVRPLQGRMECLLGLPWAASACGGLAHGYYRSAFQAATRDGPEAAGSDTDP